MAELIVPVVNVPVCIGVNDSDEGESWWSRGPSDRTSSENDANTTCFAAVAELLGRGAFALGLGLLYYSGVGLAAQGGLLWLEGSAMSSRLVFTATARSAGATGAMEMWFGRLTFRAGSAQTSAAAASMPDTPLSIWPINAMQFIWGGGFLLASHSKWDASRSSRQEEQMLEPVLPKNRRVFDRLRKYQVYAACVGFAGFVVIAILILLRLGQGNGLSGL